ncbi:hypothetical protein [Flagellimonas nanhaiensis]|uniref:Uncharacterized protein n=1 Tax=Flagellimonas nanhaiensis TaxID=2292706 RepID=A0A371JKW1_9FLAO|nr:hypothetical protein [Allomuricauda nanhaiensis]RDY57568.1 hypothetical protein DX873_18595 [Allomuricauda nanhaiensis]
MLIDRIYRKVQSFLNTETRGTLAPNRFNEFLHNAIQSRTEEYFYDVNRALNRQNRGLQGNYLQNVPDRILEKVQHYSVTATLAYDTDSTRTLPNDLKYIDTVEYTDGTVLEGCKNRREFNILKSQANGQFPIYMKSADLLWVSPTTNGLMTITYLRNPLIPKWTHQDLGGGQYAFDPTAGDFQDADIHPSEEDEMVRRVLMAAGVNLKEKDVQAFAMTEEQNEFRTDNTN